MIADRDNNRILIVNPDKQIVWRFPTPGALAPGQVLPGPDDAFLFADHRGIITNEEFSDNIAVLSLTRDPRVAWEDGHPAVQGSSPGYLAHPDDPYLLADGDVQVCGHHQLPRPLVEPSQAEHPLDRHRRRLLAQSSVDAPGTKR
jgi:hypothetical protein